MKKKYTAKELEPISKALLSEDSKQIQQLVMKRLETLIEEMMQPIGQRMWRLEQNQLDLKELILKLTDEVSGETTEFKEVSKEEAKAVIKDYVLRNPGCLTSQMIKDLRLNPEIVVEALKELTKEGEIKGRSGQ